MLVNSIPEVFNFNCKLQMRPRKINVLFQVQKFSKLDACTSKIITKTQKVKN